MRVLKQSPTVRRVVLILITLLLLNACGTKGALYMPRPDEDLRTRERTRP
jgi:predicted small lipoprotein YifL